jgi:D-alanine-D-alanine ligase
MSPAANSSEPQGDKTYRAEAQGITPRNIALLAGGNSAEREVSMNSGANAAAALRSVGHQVTEIDTAEPDFVSRLIESKPDAVFIALHGQGGEDGQIQGLLELLGLPYTGSGVLASALSMDKPKAKILYRNAGLYTPDFISVTQSIAGLKAVEAFIERYGLPCVVKPAADGSSIGVSIVRDMTEVNAALDEGFSISKTLLVERYIAGTEVTVPVIGNDDPIALPVIEIVPVVSDFYDYEAKYSDGGSEHIIPARLVAELLAHVQDQALLAHKALGCEGVSRSDFIVDALGTAWIIETNTIPGMTKTSLLPEAARHIGIDNGELYSKMIEWGIAAHRK